MLITLLLLPSAWAAGDLQSGLPAPPARSVPGRLGDDGLFRWGNGRLEVARSPFLPGAELVLAGTWLAEGFAWRDCSWETPAGEEWRPVGDSVIDSEGRPVEGVEVWGEAPRTCGLRILAAEEEHAGQWFLHSSEETIRPTLTLALETADSVATGLRLPHDFRALAYDIGLVPELNKTAETLPGQRTLHSFRGWSDMEVEALATQSWFTFHSDELTINELEIIDSEMLELKFDEIHLDFQRTFVHVHAPNFFKEGEVYRVHTTFEANLDRGSYFAYGFYHRACNDMAMDVHCWYTQFESTNARNAFPCLDEPSFKANFTLSVGRNAAFQTRSNMPLKETVPDLDPVWTGGLEGWMLDVYRSSVEMSPYLVAVAVHNYMGLESEAAEGTVAHTVWAPEEAIRAGRADYAAAVGPAIIRLYEEYFGVRYPLPKMDLMLEPHKGGAMENWGLILFDERALLIDTADTDADYRFQVLSIIAHEVAHQWFGNLVTTAWWDQTWLNEGFATYVSYIGASAIDPDSHPWERLYVKEMQRVMASDQNTNSHWAMSDAVGDRSDVDRKFGKYTYQKGGSVIRMMEQMVGLEPLTAGLSSYLAAMAFSSSTEDDLFFHIEAAAMAAGTWPQPAGPQGTFGETMKTWTRQAGLPLVTATKECSATGCTLTFSQQMLVTSGETDTARVWHLPLNWGPADGLPVAWLQGAGPLTVDDPTLSEESVLLLNTDGFGYYRVLYDEANWRAIAAVLRSDRTSVSALSRASIICDVLALERSGHVSADIMVDVLSYIDEEEDYGPLLAFELCSAYARADYTGTEEDMFRI